MKVVTKACPNPRCQHGGLVEVGTCEYMGDRGSRRSGAAR